MDTGFRRYDGSLMPVRHPDRTFTFIFSGNSIENTCAEMIRATKSHRFRHTRESGYPS